jgi:hypothetical protein
MKLTAKILCLINLFSALAHAAPTIIFSDSFNRTGSLAGSSPTSGPIPGPWVGGNQTTGGFMASVTYNVSVGDLSTITVALNTDTIYTLSTSIQELGTNPGATPSNWLGFGFGDYVGSVASAAMYLRDDGVTVSYANGVVSGNSGTSSANYQIKLTTGSSLSLPVTVEYFRNGSSLVTSNISGPINKVFVQNTSDMRGIYEGLSLTAVAIPETSSALLGGVGILGLAIRRRRSM